MSNVTETRHWHLAKRNYRTLTLGQGFSIAVAVLDIAVIVILSIVAGISYHIYNYGEVGILANYAVAGGLVSLFYLLPRCVQGQYEVTEIVSGRHPTRKIFYTWIFALFCVLVVAFLAKMTDVYSRGAAIIFCGLGFAGLALIRAKLVRLVLSGFSAGWMVSRRMILLGTQAKIDEFMKRCTPRRYGFVIADIETLPDAALSDPENFRNDELQQLLKQAIMHARKAKVDDIVLLIPWSDSRTIKMCTDALMAVPASIHLGPEQIFDRFRDLRLSQVGTATGLNLVRPPLRPSEVLAKRVFDLMLASAGLLVLSPLLLLVALLIKLDSAGSAFFVQRRHGFNWQPFRIIKFRTMTTNEDGPVVRQAMENDTRITTIGRFLRRWNIDELPQLLNVIKGDMSIVGPRPHAMAHNDEYEQRIARYAHRHNVKPGITGWAQINGLRGRTDTDEKMNTRIEYDLHYIDNWSIWFDIYIIAMTILSPRSFLNAY